MNEDWQGLCRRFMACRGFRGYWGADEGRWVLGWIRELRMGKRERDAERAFEKSDAKIWLAVVKARSWWSKLDKMALTEEARDAGYPMLAVVQQWRADKAAAAWRREVDARIQGLGHAICCMQQAAQAWGVGKGAELQRQEEAYFIAQKQERNTVQAQGWAGDGAEEKDEDDKCDKGKNMVVKKDASLKSNNMVVRKNLKKKADVAKEENGERLIN